MKTQTGDHLWAAYMVLSCPIEHSPISYDPLHNPRPMRPVHFPLVAAHHPPSQAKEILCFWTPGKHMSVKMVITTVKAYFCTQELL